MVQSPYRDQSRAWLAQSEEALARGDLRAASEKGWSAASHMVRAVAEARGWTPEDDAEPWATYSLLSRMSREYGGPERFLLFDAAGELWLNATDGFLHPDVVAFDLADVRKFMDLLETLMGEDAPVQRQAVREEPEPPYGSNA